MLRFCGEEKASLTDYLFELEIKPTSPGKFEVTPKQIFPEKPADPSLVKNIQLFSFPDYTAIESNCFFAFAIGDTACEFKLGFVLYETSFNALCLVSPYYYPELFKFVLETYRDDRAKLIAVMKALSVEQVRHSATVQGRRFELDGGRERQKLLSMIFQYFSPFDISKIIIGMMQARHIYVISARASLCSQISAGLSLLIQPFRWDMNTIPVLPMQLRDAAQVPVPTLIGITSIEVLTEGSISSHIAVNLDLGVVIDNPPLELNSPQRLSILSDQLAFHQDCVALLTKWRSCPGFPHLQVFELLRRFVFQYLKNYIGDVHNKDEFFQNLRRLPDTLDTSQVLNDIKEYNQCPPKLKEGFERWFEEIFDGNKQRPSARIAPLFQEKSAQKPTAVQQTKSQPAPVADLLGFNDPKPVSKRKSPTDDPFALFSQQPASRASSSNFPKQDDLLSLFDTAPKQADPLKGQQQLMSDPFGSPKPSTLHNSFDSLRQQKPNQNNDDLLTLF